MSATEINIDEDEEANSRGSPKGLSSCTPKEDRVETPKEVVDIEISQKQYSQAIVLNFTSKKQEYSYPFFSNFKGSDKWLIIISSVAAILMAVCSSLLLILLMKTSINADINSCGSTSESDNNNKFITNMMFCTAAVGLFVFSFIYLYCWTVIGKQVQSAIRRELYLYLEAIIKQDIERTSFDHNEMNNICTQVLERIFKYMALIQDATTVEKAGRLFIYLISIFIISFIISLTQAPLLTLSGFIPFAVLAAFLILYIKVIIKSQIMDDSQEQEAACSSTVDADSSFSKSVEKIQKSCKYVQTEAILEGVINGLCDLISLCLLEFQLWLGNAMSYSGTEVIVAIQCTVIGFKTLCLALPYWSSLAAGRDGAANEMSETIKTELREDA